jgi:Uma2 family endonuclease
MAAAEQISYLTVEDYLEGEAQAKERHEYLAGVVYAMAGTSLRHNQIAGNLLVALRGHLRGKCGVFMSDVKARLKVNEAEFFYYPDVIVGCDPRDTATHWLKFPQVIFEILSPDTERIDRTEKYQNYIQIPSLQEYVLVAQDRSEVTVFRRANNWRPEIVKDSSQAFELPSLQFSMPLSAVYEGVTFK